MPNTPRSKQLKKLDRISFRQHGPVYLAVAVLCIVLTFALYLLAGVLDWLDVPMETYTVTTCETGVGCYTTGYIVRQEQVLTSNCSMTTLALTEGQKAAAGQTVAVGYTTNEARQQQAKISQLEARLQQLQYAGGGSAVYDQAALDAEIRQRLLEIAVLQGRGDLISVTDVATELKGLVLRGSADEATLANLTEQVSQVQSEINRLKSQSVGQTEVITAPAAGYFSGSVDGYETVLTPDKLNVLSVTELERITPGAQPAGAVGKLITGDTWYYATTVAESYAKDLTPGTVVTVSFAHDMARDLSMKVSHVSQVENGKCVVVLSADHFLQEATMMRSQSADMVMHTYAGLYVPKDTVRVLEDGRIGVYVLETTNVKWKPVNILYDSGESYVVELDKSSTGHLWPGDEIIVDGKDLYDGKVVMEK